MHRRNRRASVRRDEDAAVGGAAHSERFASGAGPGREVLEVGERGRGRLRHRLVDAGPRIRHLAGRGLQRQRLGCAGGFESEGEFLEIGEEHRGSVDLVARRGGREGPRPVSQLIEPRDEV